MIESKNSIYTEAFEYYTKMGLDPIPIPYEDGHPTKGPKIAGWQTTAANGGYTGADFAGPCNIGILLGGDKHLTDIDCDAPEAVAAGGDVLGHLMEKTGNTMMFGRNSKPRSHFIFYCDESRPSEKVTDPLDPKITVVEYRCIKDDGGRGHQTVFPPSINYDPKTGTAEKVAFEEESAPEPVWVEASKLHRSFRTIAAVAILTKYFPEHAGRHETILALAGIFARNGVPEQEAVTIVTLAYRNSRGYNGDESKAESDVRSVYLAHATEPTTHLYGYPKLTEIMPKAVVDKVLDLLDILRAPESGSNNIASYPATGTGAYNFTDAGNGRRLVDKHHDDVRYCVDDKDWYVWDGVRWRKDVVKKIRELAKDIAADLRNEASAMKPPAPTVDEDRDKEGLSRYEGRKKELLKWANQSENAEKVSKTILSAESDPRITCFRSDFDRDSHLLNCANGVVDVYAGTMVPHDRKYMMSNLCPVEFDPSVTHPVWDESLAAFTRKHQDVLPFLKRVAGYSVQGNKTEERILILYGPGNAGKGTFMDWLTSALGPDYACAMDANSVLKQKRDSAAASGDIARLQGKRLVVVSEIEKGSKVQESFMKQASGNDLIVARGLYRGESEFRPTHQFWFQTNYRPGFDSTDSGNKRRYVEIPFDNDLSADPLVKFDSKLKIRMREDKEFLKAVLAWAVAGAVEWRQNGLQIPDSVQAATAALFAHNDFLNNFLTEMCVVDPVEKVGVKALADTYNQWCEEQGEDPAHGRTFNKMMEERGFERRQARIHGLSGKAWTGIRVKEHDELVAAFDGGGGAAASPEGVVRSESPTFRFTARKEKAFATALNGRAKVG